MFRLMAALVQRHVFSRTGLHLLCGWHDSSGYDGCYIQKELLTLPFLQGLFPPEDSDWAEQAKAASRFWLLETIDTDYNRERLVLFDLRGAVRVAPNYDDPWDPWTLYLNNGRNFNALANELHARLQKHRPLLAE